MKITKKELAKIIKEEAVQLDAFSQKQYEDALQSHDWYYTYSDDHSVWGQGLTSEKLVLTTMSKVHKALAKKLFMKYALKEFDFNDWWKMAAKIK